jgi:hypothetical protein
MTEWNGTRSRVEDGIKQHQEKQNFVISISNLVSMPAQWIHQVVSNKLASIFKTLLMSFGAVSLTEEVNLLSTKLRGFTAQRR